MAKGPIEVQVVDRGVLVWLERARAKLAGDLEDEMREVAEVLMDAVEENFAAEGQTDGATTHKWEPLAESTQADRRREGYGAEHPILKRSGALLRSVTTDSGRDWAQIGANLTYAAIHQFGGEVQHQTAARFAPVNVRGRFISRAAARRSTALALSLRYLPSGQAVTRTPARPFLPVNAAGELSPPGVAARVVEVLAEAFRAGTGAPKTP